MQPSPTDAPRPDARRSGAPQRGAPRLPHPGRTGLSPKAGIALAVTAYAAALSSSFWGAALIPRLPEDYLSSLLIGLAIGFQTLVIADWQRSKGRSPRSLTVFLLTAIGGGSCLLALLHAPDLWRNGVVLCAAGLAVMAASRLLSTLRKRAPRRREALARARDAGLIAAAILSLIGLLADLSGLVVLPLWLALTIGGWIAASAYTGTLWWHRRRFG